jgi:epoxyqueuosine reductase QueG
MQFEDILRNIIEEECEDYFMGVADLSLVKESLIEQYGSLIDEYPQAISIGITLPQRTPKELHLDENIEFHHDSNRKLEVITERLSSFLQKRGYRTFCVPTIQNGRIFPYLHKLAANKAGLGKIGKNGLLITPEVGAGVKWGTLLTNVPL